VGTGFSLYRRAQLDMGFEAATRAFPHFRRRVSPDLVQRMEPATNGGIGGYHRQTH
jgi:hypothetical protein